METIMELLSRKTKMEGNDDQDEQEGEDTSCNDRKHRIRKYSSTRYMASQGHGFLSTRCHLLTADQSKLGAVLAERTTS